MKLSRDPRLCLWRRHVHPLPIEFPDLIGIALFVLISPSGLHSLCISCRCLCTGVDDSSSRASADSSSAADVEHGSESVMSYVSSDTAVIVPKF